MEEGSSLYADILASEPSFREKELEAQLAACRKHISLLEDRLVTLEEKERLLETKNGALEKNISCLYLTAKAELARKDAMLMDLRAKNTLKSGD